jgi:hypothetical protein
LAFWGPSHVPENEHINITPPRVELAGRVPHSDVSRYYSVIDLLVTPTAPADPKDKKKWATGKVAEMGWRGN